jgi:hypothetical protein
LERTRHPDGARSRPHTCPCRSPLTWLLPSRRPYYCNPATGETRWDPPPVAAPPLPPGWTSAVDPASGCTYYHNSVTGTTQWEPPSALPPPTFALPPHSAGGGAHASQSSSTLSHAAVRVHGLPPAMSDSEVRELFGSCGKIVSVVLDRAGYSSGSVPKGGVVTFDAKGSADVAVAQMNGTKLRNNRLTVELVGGAAGGARAASRPY